MLGWPLAGAVTYLPAPPCHDPRPRTVETCKDIDPWWCGCVVPARSLHTSTTRDVKTDQTLRTTLPVAFRASNPHTQRGPCCPCTDGSTTGSGIQGQTGRGTRQAGPAAVTDRSGASGAPKQDCRSRRPCGRGAAACCGNRARAGNDKGTGKASQTRRQNGTTEEEGHWDMDSGGAAVPGPASHKMEGERPSTQLTGLKPSQSDHATPASYSSYQAQHRRPRAPAVREGGPATRACRPGPAPPLRPRERESAARFADGQP